MTILGTKHKQNLKMMEDDHSPYDTKTYSLIVRLHDSGGVEGELARKRFEDTILNTVIRAGKGTLRVVSLTD